MEIWDTAVCFRLPSRLECSKGCVEDHFRLFPEQLNFYDYNWGVQITVTSNLRLPNTIFISNFSIITHERGERLFPSGILTLGFASREALYILFDTYTEALHSEAHVHSKIYND